MIGWSGKAKIDDEPLERMLYLGLLDPIEGNSVWSNMVSVPQGVRLVSNAISTMLILTTLMRHPVG